MENNKECEIVQDLLIGYADGTLNKDSKKLVEKHLKECDFCTKKLKEIQEDAKESLEFTNKDIDYLKKFRRKSNIKALLIALLVIFLIVLVYYIRNAIIFAKLEKNAREFVSSNNFYSEMRVYNSSDSVGIFKNYYKDGKFKEVWQVCRTDGIETISETYAELNSDTRTTVYTEKKEAVVTKGETMKLMNTKQNLTSKLPSVELEYGDNKDINKAVFRVKLLRPFSIMYKDTKQVGKEYYVQKSLIDDSSQRWIDIETGMAIRLYGTGTSIEYYSGTDIIKEQYNTMQEFKCSKDTVTDEDVTIPDLSEYKIEYVNDTDNISE